MTTIMPRSAWTSTGRGFARYGNRKLVPSRIAWLAVHYPGAGNFVAANDSRGQTAARLRGYRDFHVRTRGWADIGYCDAVDQQGRIWNLAGVTHAAAHSASARYPNANYEGLGLLAILGNNEKPTIKMRRAIRAYRKMRRKTFRRMTPVYGHQQMKGASTACPGKAMMALIRAGDFVKNAVLPKPAPSKPKSNPFKVAADKDWGPVMSGSFQWALANAGFTGHSIDKKFGRYSVLSMQKWLRAKGYKTFALDALTFESAYVSDHHVLVTALQEWLNKQGKKYRNHAVEVGS